MEDDVDPRMTSVIEIFGGINAKDFPHGYLAATGNDHAFQSHQKVKSISGDIKNGVFVECNTPRHVDIVKLIEWMNKWQMQHSSMC
ncbi:hypothetical protein OUZ56_022872 [Daphnia magna]|uniref:Uncharacterized protein n=1 Tax=Daphnia magna TaxID=35525 RepID=A0ABR0AYD2_9CRUS|nr:hypothetical protein OUZ56_022872 [Daphnia magna]